MRTSAKEAKNRFGELLDRAQRGPVTIEKKGRPVAVVLSAHEYEAYKRFEEAENALWLERVRKAEKKGKFLGIKKSEEFLKRTLHATS